MAANRAKIAKSKGTGHRYERINILASLFKKGYSYRDMKAEVMQRLNLKTYSLQTVKADIDYLLKEWRDTRIENIDHNIQLELERIDALVREAWEAWEKSKQDYQRRKMRQVRVPNELGGSGENSDMTIVQAAQDTEDCVECGDPRYIDTINRLLIERRKLLGLYAPEKNINVGNTNITVGKEMSIEDMEKEIKRLQKLN